MAGEGNAGKPNWRNVRLAVGDKWQTEVSVSHNPASTKLILDFERLDGAIVKVPVPEDQIPGRTQRRVVDAGSSSWDKQRQNCIVQGQGVSRSETVRCVR